MGKDNKQSVTYRFNQSLLDNIKVCAEHDCRTNTSMVEKILTNFMATDLERILRESQKLAAYNDSLEKEILKLKDVEASRELNTLDTLRAELGNCPDVEIEGQLAMFKMVWDLENKNKKEEDDKCNDDLTF